MPLQRGSDLLCSVAKAAPYVMTSDIPTVMGHYLGQPQLVNTFRSLRKIILCGEAFSGALVSSLRAAGLPTMTLR